MPHVTIKGVEYPVTDITILDGKIRVEFVVLPDQRFVVEDGEGYAVVGDDGAVCWEGRTVSMCKTDYSRGWAVWLYAVGFGARPDYLPAGHVLL